MLTCNSTKRSSVELQLVDQMNTTKLCPKYTQETLIAKPQSARFALRRNLLVASTG